MSNWFDESGPKIGTDVALAVMSNMILGPLLQGAHEHLITILAALAGGSGKRLATSIISKFDASHPTTSSNDSGRGTAR